MIQPYLGQKRCKSSGRPMDAPHNGSALGSHPRIPFLLAKVLLDFSQSLY
jgi:hypothetical protein